MFGRLPKEVLPFIFILILRYLDRCTDRATLVQELMPLSLMSYEKWRSFGIPSDMRMSALQVFRLYQYMAACDEQTRYVRLFRMGGRWMFSPFQWNLRASFPSPGSRWIWELIKRTPFYACSGKKFGNQSERMHEGLNPTFNLSGRAR